jgi:hypothetical protein
MKGRENSVPGEKQDRAPNEYRIHQGEDESHTEVMAKVAASPIVRAAATARKYTDHLFGEVDMTDYVGRLSTQSQAVVDGDLSALKRMLTSQASTLDAIFNLMATKAAKTDHLPRVEGLMRMALKAQGQCANTVRVLGELQNPRSVAFIKQQNNATNQQVNNGSSVQPAPPVARVHEESPTNANELLEHHHGEWLDGSAASAASRGNQELAAVGTVNRPEVSKGESSVSRKRTEARPSVHRVDRGSKAGQ